MKKNTYLKALAKYLALALCIPTTSGCTHRSFKQPNVVASPTLDLQAYLGTWYEIASLPNPFQKGCSATQATYSLNASGQDIQVINACRRGGLDKPLTSKQGTAWQPDPAHPARLKVQFFWPFSGDYWVLAAAQDYSWAVVGQPSRRYLWLLSRTRKASPDVVAKMKNIAISQGYDLTPLSVTAQP